MLRLKVTLICEDFTIEVGAAVPVLASATSSNSLENHNELSVGRAVCRPVGLSVIGNKISSS